ncbi:hypothetical protein MHU86_1340 [Fragilaria crotonensis]|nr:hypothetical protein MHU86_1340 [Fragilaria crotonensis]
MASYEGHWDVVLELLKHENVDVNATGICGYTALMWATLGGRMDVVSELLQHDKLDINARNMAGSTALDIARNFEMIDALEIGRNCDMIDDLEIARMCAMIEMQSSLEGRVKRKCHHQLDRASTKRVRTV